MKIGPVVSAENILIEIALRVHVVFGVFRRISLDVLDRFSQSFHHLKAHYVPMILVALVVLFNHAYTRRYPIPFLNARGTVKVVEFDVAKMLQN